MNAITKYQNTRAKLFEEFHTTAQSKYLETIGPFGKIHYLESGQGSPLVLVHGGLGHSSEWIPLLKPLSERYHLFIVDRPGHGLTNPMENQGIGFRQNATAFIHTFMKGIGVPKAILIGSSMGGYFSICFALEYPWKVEKLLLIGAPAGLNRWIPALLRALGTKGLNRILIKTLARPSIAGHKKIHKKLLVADISKISKNYLEHSCENHQLPGALDSMTDMLESVLTYRGWRKKLCLVNELKYLKMPVHFIWGDKDTFESPKTGKQKASQISGSTFDTVQNAGHSPWLDQPDVCASLILIRLGQ